MILLIGTGYMGKEYAKVLKGLSESFIAVGRSPESVKNFTDEIDSAAVSGGLAQWLQKNKCPSRAIVAVTEDELGIATRELLNAGCRSILVEKPGGFDIKDIRAVAVLANKKKADVYVGYNRRFYASTLKAMEMIKKEGVSSFNFDFTERSYAVEELKQSDAIKREWFLQNSTHVIDMAFHLGGWPEKMYCFGKDKLTWHPDNVIYAGSGISDKGVLFSYHANWKSAGRWSLEVMTPKSKLIFRPLEKLQIQKYGSMTVEDVPLDDALDQKYKPGLYRQTKAFVENKKGLSTIEEQISHLVYYEKIKRGV
ncbi:MAG: hypothetical protein A3D67_02865 [Candidatus Lloydbacteria bacterium RIFCSPHIGHO2_02_FULL_51_22]|uniref:Gfo/Idh/MocA-like oxidoreductase N-terminal domain-containing protein n=2 Tax=Candidatus Lloydiibacteriota TaxID=1817910 RepID=A0A1G2DIU4_9BACT|nr:MAG: hypothetical protein A3D67_02865 [Candidatus Lloydbacteria bacterium RIFCSPHIGHO2_02_FULL_51_22]OGZ15151.1 MAG: hypothetical protein A3J08_02725 [Candidatus Lloydbacteria bacterium RIFCSPLOWO2_02_FULL_51_11]